MLIGIKFEYVSSCTVEPPLTATSKTATFLCHQDGGGGARGSSVVLVKE